MQRKSSSISSRRSPPSRRSTSLRASSRRQDPYDQPRYSERDLDRFRDHWQRPFNEDRYGRQPWRPSETETPHRRGRGWSRGMSQDERRYMMSRGAGEGFSGDYRDDNFDRDNLRRDLERDEDYYESGERERIHRNRRDREY